MENSTQSNFWIVLFACIGGVVVLLGLFLELGADKKAFKSARSLHFWESSKKLGEYFVIAGILIEIAVAGISAVDAHKTWRMANNNDPRNANISDMSATAILFVKETHFNELTNWNPRRVADMMLCEKGDITRSKFDMLNADNFTVNDFKTFFGGTAGDREYGIRFRSFNFRAFVGQEMPVSAIDGVDVLRLDLNFLPHGVIVTSGGVELVVNSTHKMFLIQPQTDTNPPDGSPGFPYVLFATNQDLLK